MNYHGSQQPSTHSPHISLYMDLVAHIPRDDEEGAKMAYLRRSSKDKDTVGRFKLDSRCRKHPKHEQSPGVCSLCLRDKLSRLSTTSSSRRTISATAASSSSSSVSSLSSYYSSSSASSCASPMHRFRFTTARGKSSASSVSIFLLNRKHGLVKSRSMAVASRRRREQGVVDNKKGGFWFKLLHPKSKRIEEKDTTTLSHSGSVTEEVIVAS